MTKKMLLGFLIIWIVSVLSFWIFPITGNEMIYSVLVLYILLPITILFLSIIIGKGGSQKNIKYIVPILFGVIYMLTEYLTFSLANMTTFNKLNMPELSIIITGSVISYIGVLVGLSLKNKG